jgi:hypothetical protein
MSEISMEMHLMKRIFTLVLLVMATASLRQLTTYFTAPNNGRTHNLSRTFFNCFTD